MYVIPNLKALNIPRQVDMSLKLIIQSINNSGLMDNKLLEQTDMMSLMFAVIHTF